MYREARSVNKNPQVSVVQIMMSIGIVVVALILPIYAVEKIRNTTPVPYSAEALSSSSAGRVAGVSTVLGESKITIPFTTTQVDTTSQEGMLLIVGGVLIVVAAVIILYLIATSGRHQKTNRR